MAFFPLRPATLGHTLVIPTTHVPDIWTLDESTASSLARATLAVARAVKKAVQPEGLNVIQSNGAVATQTVGHLHVHVVPRWKGDAMGQIWPTKSVLATERDGEMSKTNKALEAIKEALGNPV